MPVNPAGRMLPLLPQVGEERGRPGMFRALSIASSGLAAQRFRMELIAENVANAETTRGADGQPYRRRDVTLEEARVDAFTPLPALPPAGDVAARPLMPGETDAARPARSNDPSLDLAGVRVSAVVEDATPGPLVYDPGHPDADGQGYVRMPNVSVPNEMANLLEARRAYEANATVFQVARAMLRKAIDI